MKLVFAEEMRALDKLTVEKIGLPSMVLMENAGKAVAEAAETELGNCAQKTIVIFVGKGNNGGDGIVAARHLASKGAKVQVVFVTPWQDLIGDVAAQVRIARKYAIDFFEVTNIQNTWDIAEILVAKADLVIDAILGTGFNGELQGEQQRACRLINDCASNVLAIDLPSGINADTGAADVDAVVANIVVVMGLLKPGLLLYPAAEIVGKIILADIGFSPKSIDEIASKKFLITKEVVRPLLPLRAQDAHKGEAGRVTIVAGSPGYVGAAALCAQAAVKAGSGLVSLLTPHTSENILAIKLNEVMVQGLIERMPGVLGGGAVTAILDKAGQGNSLAIGPGLGTFENTAEVIREVLQKIEIPVVVDADGLTVLQGHTEILQTMNAPKILTPHPGELARLIGMTPQEVNSRRVEIAQIYAQKWNAVIVLKGAPTVIACPDGTVYLNSTGNSAMATGGSGDVLTGIIASQLAQGNTISEAAIISVYLHGLAGDLVSNKMLGLAAGEISICLPKAREILLEE